LFRGIGPRGRQTVNLKILEPHEIFALFQ